MDFTNYKRRRVDSPVEIKWPATIEQLLAEANAKVVSLTEENEKLRGILGDTYKPLVMAREQLKLMRGYINTINELREYIVKLDVKEHDAPYNLYVSGLSDIAEHLGYDDERMYEEWIPVYRKVGLSGLKTFLCKVSKTSHLDACHAKCRGDCEGACVDVCGRCMLYIEGLRDC